MNAVLVLTIIALATPIFSQEVEDAKKQEKRGVLGLGYYGGLGYGGYGHGLAPTYAHGYASPVAISHGYTSYNSPLRVGYHGLGLGHGLGYVHGW